VKRASHNLLSLEKQNLKEGRKIDMIEGRSAVSRPERFYRIYAPFRRKDLVTRHFTIN